MANPVVGYVDCPHCGDTATVHREARGIRAMYYRCYDADGMSMRCGTVQIRGPAGQVWIEENMRSVPGPGSSPAAAASVEAPVRRRRGLWDLVAEGADDD